MLPIENTYEIAPDEDVSKASISSLMQCTDSQRLALDLMSFGNFSNEAVQTLQKGSRATVVGVLYGPAPSEIMPMYAASETDLRDVANAPNNTTYHLCLIPSPAGATYAIKVCASVEYDADRCGYYETGTQNRVFGECRKVGGVFPVAYKRRYFHPSAIDAFLKIYSNGLEGIFRKIRAYNPDIVATPISNYVPTEAVAETGIIPGLITVQYPCVVNVWIKYAASPLFKLFPDGCGSGSGTNTKALIGGRYALSIGLLRQHTDGAWMTFGAPVIMRGLNSTYNNKSVQIPVPSPGKYKLYIESGWDTIVYGGSSSAPTITTYACGIEQISASVSSVFGSTVDY